MESEEIALFHIEAALALTSYEFIRDYLDMQVNIETTTSVTTVKKECRGRKPGAADEAHRCHWKLQDNTQCKNSKLDGGDYCKTHKKRALMLATEFTPEFTPEPITDDLAAVEFAVASSDVSASS